MEDSKARTSSEYVDVEDPLLEKSLQSKPSPYSWLSRVKRLIFPSIITIYVIFSALALAFLLNKHIPQPYCKLLSVHVIGSCADSSVAPASHVLFYERQPLYFGEDARYTGLPDEVDEAWDALLERKCKIFGNSVLHLANMMTAINIRTTKDELRQARSPTSDDIVQVNDGGYVSVLSVYHELHCLVSFDMGSRISYAVGLTLPNVGCPTEKYIP